MLTLVTDQLLDEPDILTPSMFETFKLQSLEGAAIASVQPPPAGWAHEQLVAVADQYNDCLTGGADAYLGGLWVGSTEV